MLAYNFSVRRIHALTSIQTFRDGSQVGDPVSGGSRFRPAWSGGATTKEIARAAGVSEALLYRHFASKEVLYAELES
ncbi:MAG: helix-turn-helix transcriptional regulator [Komagataeibacter hansenii]|nr:helix-turn-helix transcriptional regulator [Novacetimonas hansenii]